MLNVIIVDDEVGIISLIKSLIDYTRFSIEVIGTAGNGEEALKLIREKHPNVVITDIKMSGMNGIDKSFERFVWNETAEKIGIDPALYNTPIRKLSSLIQFQIVLSRALLMKPEIIVLDNCIEGLDVRLRNYIFEFIMEAKRRKIGILYFGQLTQLAYNICDVFAF